MIDHIILACTDERHGADMLAKALGTPLQEGGAHPGRGTKNWLGSLGDSYLELLVPDLSQGNVGDAAAMTLHYDEPSLFSWCIRSRNLGTIAASFRRLGYTTEGPVPAQRQTADTLLKWDMLFIRDHPFGGVIPFFIDWGASPLPSTTLPKVGADLSVDVTLPDQALCDTLNELSGTSLVTLGQPALSCRVIGRAGGVSWSAATPLPPGL